jgi:hypothetical protein
MITRSKIVRLEWKLNPSAFAITNKKTIGENTRKLGSTVKVVGRLMERSDEMKLLMPSILGYDSNSTNINWTDMVRRYWSGITISVPPGGKELEIGLTYDIADLRRKEYIKELQKDHPDIKTDENLAEFVEGSTDGKPNVEADEYYKYASPINGEDFMYWRFATFHREVANNIDDANKSPNIRFYLYSNEELKAVRKETFKLSRDATTKYLQVLGDKQTVSDLLSIFNIETADMDDVDKDMALDTIVKNSPKDFLAAVNDSNLKTKARIERYIKRGVLKRLPNTAIIVDASDPSIVIGNTINEAVAFFSSDGAKNKAIISELSVKYKALT